MRRIGWAGCVLAIGCLAATAGQGGATEGPRSDADVIDLLGRWQRRMEPVTSIEVKFRKTTTIKAWGDRKSEGRMALAAPNLALIEATPVDESGKPSDGLSRQIWTGQDLLIFDGKTNQVFRFRRTDDRSGPPRALRDFFFFRSSVDRARGQFDWKMLGEREGGVWLAATPKVGGFAPTGADSYRIMLDKASLLPGKVVVLHQDGERDIYELRDYRFDAQVDDELKDPCLDAWQVVEPLGWLTRWLAR